MVGVGSSGLDLSRCLGADLDIDWRFLLRFLLLYFDTGALAV